MLKTIPALVILILGGLVCSPCHANLDWPHWRGPAKNGISQETAWSCDWGTQGPKVLWRKQVGTGFSSMAVSQGRVYTQGNTGTKGDKKTLPHEDVIHCFDARTGRTIWQHRYPNPLQPEGYEGGTSSTPTVADNRVYTLSKHGQVFCLDATSGEIIWHKDLVKAFGIDLPTWGLSSSPLLVDTTVVLNAGTHGLALSQADGALVWSTGKGKAGYSTPVEYRVGDLACLALFGEDTFAGIKAHTGELLWEIPWKARYDENIADPIIHNGHMFVSSFLGDRCSLFKIERDKLIELWQRKDLLNWLNSSVLWQGYVYGVHAKDRTLKCLDLKTGNIKWTYPDVGLGSLMMADGKLIVLTEKGRLLIGKASPDGFEPMATADVLGGKCWTVPVLSHGRIYARNAQGDLVCIDVSQPRSKADIPSGGQALLSRDLASYQFGARKEAQATGTIVPVQGQPFPKAWHIAHRKRPKEPWFVTLHVNIDGAIQKGDTLWLGLTMRCLSSDDESGDGVARIHIQDRTSHQRIGAYVARAGKTWQSLFYPLQAERSAAKGQANISIHLGGSPQTVELADIRLINYGTSVTPDALPMTRGSYQGQAPDAAWRTEALQRIEALRKGPLQIQVVDHNGKAVPRARVRAELTRHAFGFGSVVHPTFLMAQGENGDRYRDMVAGTMNKAPLETGFRWQNWFAGSDRRRKQSRTLLDQSLDWLNAHHIEVRGHYLMWAPLSPGTQPEALLADGPALQKALFAHMAEKSQFAGQRVQEWDAINHIIGWGQRYADVTGSQEIYAKVIRLGRQLNPHAEMWINEGQILPGGSRREPYLAMIKYLQQQQAGPDGIGFMGHFTNGSLTGMDELKGVYDEFAQLGVPLQITELDVDTGFDEHLQADYLRDVLTLSFSHPAMEGINLWGFWEGRHWRPKAALWRKNWAIKPAGQVWLDLVHKQWRTRASGTTDPAGHFQTQGFFGEYTITVIHKDKRTTRRFALTRNTPNITITLD
jgi:outer membrane protein assembly factor BamB